MDITYDIYKQLKELLTQGYSFEELSKIFKMDRKPLKNMIEEVRRNAIYSSDKNEFYIIDIIDNMIGRYERKINYEQFLTMISENLPYESICKKYNINIFEYIIFLKNLYLYVVKNNFGIKYEDMVMKEIIHINEIAEQKKSKFKRYPNLYNVDEKSMFKVKGNNTILSNAPVRYIKDLGAKDNFRMLVISDTHYGNKNENMFYINDVYDYASKNSIKYISHCGDVIEGSLDLYRSCKDEYKTALSQIEHVLYDYPYDKNIENLFLFGNHDLSTLTIENIDIYDEFQNRDDFIPLGYRNSYIKCGNEFITLKHEVNKMINFLKDEETFLYLSGHKHGFYACSKERSAVIKIPTLSDVYPNGFCNTGFIDLSIDFVNGNASRVECTFIPLGNDEKNKCLILK